MKWLYNILEKRKHWFIFYYLYNKKKYIKNEISIFKYNKSYFYFYLNKYFMDCLFIYNNNIYITKISLVIQK